MNEPINSSSIAIGSLSTFSLHGLLGCGHHTFLVIKGSNSKHRSASASLAMMTPVSSSRWMERGCAVDTDGPIRWRTLQQLSGSIYDFMILWSSTSLVTLLLKNVCTMPATGAPAWAQCIPRSCCLWNSLTLHIKFGRSGEMTSTPPKVTWYLPVPSAWCCTKVQDQIAGLHLSTIFWSCFALCCCSICSTKPDLQLILERSWKIHQTSMNFMDFLNF